MVSESVLHGLTYLWVERVVSVLLLLSVGALSVIHTLKSYKFMIGGEGHSKAATNSAAHAIYRKASHVCTILMLFLNTAFIFHFALNSWGAYENGSCDAIKKMSVLLLHLGKGMLYLVLVLRLQVAFSDSSVIHNLKIKIRILYAGVSAFFILSLICDPLIVGGHNIQITDSITGCFIDELPTWGVGMSVIFDLTLSLACLYYFDRPLTQLIRSTDRNEHLTRLLTRYAILTTLAIVSTLLTQFGTYFTGLGVIGTSDTVINAVCVILMSSWYSKWYQRLCCCFENGINHFKVLKKTTIRRLNSAGVSYDSSGNKSPRSKTAPETVDFGSRSGDMELTINSKSVTTRMESGFTLETSNGTAGGSVGKESASNRQGTMEDRVLQIMQNNEVDLADQLSQSDA